MINLKNLSPSDFPDLDPASFLKWKKSRAAARATIICFLVGFLPILFIYRAMIGRYITPTEFLLFSSTLGVIVFLIVLQQKRQLRQYGLDLNTIKKVIASKQFKACPHCNSQMKWSEEHCNHCHKNAAGQLIGEPTQRHVATQTSSSTLSHVENGRLIEIRSENREPVRYKVQELKDEVLSGNIRKDYEARIVGPNTKWSTVEKIINTDFNLQTMYRPIWAHTKQGFTYGALIGIILKGLILQYCYFRLIHMGLQVLFGY